MQATNRAQTSYYDVTSGGAVSEVNSAATNLWRILRQRSFGVFSGAVRQVPYDIHKEWMGDLSDKKVLDLGCGTGMRLTRYMVRNAREYHAIDLSEAQVGALRAKHSKVPGARFIAGDFLAEGSVDKDYDVIYAHSVAHHFRYLQPFLDRVAKVLAPGGVLITLDPLQTWAPARMLRALFRPFQTDADWEFPFTSQTMAEIDARCEVVDRIGIFGRAKWAMVLGMINPTLGQRVGDRWFRQDFESGYARTSTKRCLVISYLLRVPEIPPRMAEAA